jgi:hypothetical protein
MQQIQYRSKQIMVQSNKNMNRVLLVIFLYAINNFLIITSCSYKHSVAPILILASSHDFGMFTPEILKTEGFNEFQTDSITDPLVTRSFLSQFDLVILTEIILTPDQSRLLGQYVKKGGNLIVFRPDKKISDVLGISYTGNTTSEGYIAVDTAMEIGRGMVWEPMQFHGIADLCRLNGAKKIADLCLTDTTTSAMPCAVLHKYGQGHAIAFLYNLPKSIVLTRQGNYRHAGQELDGINGLRGMDLFTGGWVDTSKNWINQADEQMRLLTHCIEYLSTFTKPLPRFWYFPDTLKSLITLTNDGEDSNEAQFEFQFADIDSKGAKMTLYVLEPNKISKPWVEKWTDRGFEISGHPDDTKQAHDPDWNTMDSAITAIGNELKNKFNIAGMYTITNHWFVWCGTNAYGIRDFAAQAKIEEQKGIGLDCNYAHYDNISNLGHFLGPMGAKQGNYTGSGLVMKFADENGKVLNVYQQLNNVYDQQYMENKDADGYYDCFRGLLNRSLNDEVYSFICIRAHNNEYFFSKTPLMKMLDDANKEGIPVWTELKLLNFLKAKDEAIFNQIKWDNRKLSFQFISSRPHSNGVTIMIPCNYQNKTILEIMVDDKKQPFITRSIKGHNYALITIQPGTNHIFSIKYIP